MASLLEPQEYEFAETASGRMFVDWTFPVQRPVSGKARIGSAWATISWVAKGFIWCADQKAEEYKRLIDS